MRGGPRRELAGTRKREELECGKQRGMGRLGNPPTLAPVAPVAPVASVALELVPMGTIELRPLKVSINFVTWDFVTIFFLF